MIWLLLALGVAVSASALFSGLETGVYSLERVRIQVRASEGDQRANRLLALIQDKSRAICTILVANNMANYAVAALSGMVVYRLAGVGLSDVELELLSTLWITPVLFVLGELVPKSLFLRQPAFLSSLAWPVYRLLGALVQPVVAPLLGLMSRLMGEGAQPPLLARAGVVDVLTSGDEAGGLTAIQRRLARRVLGLRSIRVRDRMIPIAEVASVLPDADRATVMAEAARTGRSRLLVGADGHFLGYVVALDAAFASEPEAWRAKDHVFEAPRVPRAAPLLQALQTLQRSRRPLALVGGRGRPVGLLASADLVDTLLTVESP